MPDGDIVGWVTETHVGQSSRYFYKAVGIHRETGDYVDLESITDRQERIETPCQFWLSPLMSKRYLPYSLCAYSTGWTEAR